MRPIEYTSPDATLQHSSAPAHKAAKQSPPGSQAQQKHGGRAQACSGVGRQTGVEIGHALNIEPGFGQGLQAVEGQAADHAFLLRAQRPAAATQLAQGHLCFSSGFGTRTGIGRCTGGPIGASWSRPGATTAARGHLVGDS